MTIEVLEDYPLDLMACVARHALKHFFDHQRLVTSWMVSALMLPTFSE